MPRNCFLEGIRKWNGHLLANWPKLCNAFRKSYLLNWQVKLLWFISDVIDYISVQKCIKLINKKAKGLMAQLSSVQIKSTWIVVKYPPMYFSLCARKVSSCQFKKKRKNKIKRRYVVVACGDGTWSWHVVFASGGGTWSDI